MKRILFGALVLLAVGLHGPAQVVAWDTNLYLGNGNVFSQGIPITIRNDGDAAMSGVAVSVAIGKGEGQADLVGQLPAMLRVCDAAGAELLFAVRGPDRKPVAGVIPAGANLLIPAECPGKSSTTCYVYLDNPAAWPAPDFLEGSVKVVATATAGKVETLAARRAGEAEDWPAAATGHRVAVRALNSGTTPMTGLISVDARAIDGYLKARHQPSSFSISSGGASMPGTKVGEALFFQATIAPGTLQTWHLYPSEAASGDAGYQQLFQSPGNLVKNASFEETGRSQAPSAWSGAESNRPGLEVGLAEGSRFGRRAARIHVPATAKPNWVGWKQEVPVVPGASYLYAAWVKCQDVAGGSVQLHAHLCMANGQLVKVGGMTGVGPAITGTTDWTLIGGVLHMPADARIFQMHLTMNTTGTVWHDGVVLARVMPALTGPIESRMARADTSLQAWPVNAIVKVFKHDLPPAKANEAHLTAARNEKEPLQLAIRSRTSLCGLRITVDPPKQAGGAVLKDVQISVAGYVPIDYPTNYYRSEVPPGHRRIPTQAPGSDGWSDWWPDPLLPEQTLDLPAEETHAAWITVSIPKDAPAGDYRGSVTLSQEGKTLATIPLTVHVWDFALGDASHVKAVYDLRVGSQWVSPGQDRQKVWRELAQFMAEHRVCPDRVTPSPQLRYENGKVIADFTEFDAIASWYFDELKLPHSYTPQAFYGFGWGMPPNKAFGQEPYAGQRPFDGADRAVLRPEYKEAYQACLRVFWDHVKQKGWDKKILLYISDEPFDREPAILEQMKALCAMVHEVDPAIPIYSSTWHHVPAWDGFITAWGIGHFGVVPAEKIAQIRAAGTKVLFTTDGQMCTDTPYCAIERLLPHYCFKYDVEGYEFWGATWLTYNPYQYGWHSFIHQSDAPGKSYYIRYPNGDGYLIYPGSPIGHAGPVSSIRLEQAREGVEDYEYLWLLRQRIDKAKAAGRNVAQAQQALDLAQDLVTIPSAGGRYSTKFLPDPDKVLQAKEAVGRAIEMLK